MVRLYDLRMQRSPEDIEDELLVLRCQGGATEAFGVLVTRWQPRLLRLATRLTASRDAGSDLVQDAWLVIARGLHRLDDPARFRTWVYRIVANKCADWIRRRAVRRDAVPELQRVATARNDDSGPSISKEADEIIRLRAALRRLPDELRAILSLHYLEGLSVLEVAAVFDVPPGTVKSRLFSARAQLRNALQESHHEGTGQKNY